jgi:KTSC domain
VERIELESKMLKSAQYHEGRRALELEFQSGERYLYLQLPPDCYQKFLEAESKGNYFARHIRGRFPFQQVSREGAPIVLASKR